MKLSTYFFTAVGLVLLAFMICWTLVLLGVVIPVTVAATLFWAEAILGTTALILLFNGK